jgi:hypothetical protein
MVPDFSIRSERRHIRSDCEGGTAGELRKTKARNIDLISTVPWELTSHPGLKDAELLLCGASDCGPNMLILSTLMAPLCTH